MSENNTNPKTKPQAPKASSALGCSPYHNEDRAFGPSLGEMVVQEKLESALNDIESLRSAIRRVRDSKGRHHSEAAHRELYSLLPENANVEEA